MMTPMKYHFPKVKAIIHINIADISKRTVNETKRIVDNIDSFLGE